jgi:CubicO group peptidase (beta-lactamase class C family)
MRSCEYGYQAPAATGDGWATSSLSREGVDPVTINALMNAILSGDLPNVHSVLLVKDGKLVLEEYFNGYGRETQQIIASVTKSITSILVGIAIDKQMIAGVDEKVYAFFPGHQGTRWIDQNYAITLKHVLTMTAGLDWDETSFPHPHLNNPNTGMYTCEHPLDYIFNKQQTGSPGNLYNYNSGLTVILGAIIKNTSGLYADEFAEQYLFGPLGISDTHWLCHPDGTVFTNGDLFLKPRDMAKIGCLMLHGGKWKNRRIVTQKWVRESTREYVDTFKGYGYGYQWRRGSTLICNQKVEAFWASGTGGQKIYVFPELDLVVVFTNKVFDNQYGHMRTEAMLADYIVPAVISPAYRSSVVELSPEVLDAWVGEYKINHDQILIPDFVKQLVFTTFRKKNKMFLKLPEGEVTQLFAESETQFYGSLKGIGQFQIKLVKDENAVVKQVIQQVGFRRLLLDKVK